MPTSLPTFFVIGAAKCGTTSLHEYLAEHPEITMSSVKEPLYFQRDNWRERLTRYGDLFGPNPASVRGESSTGYSAYPWSAEVPERVRETVPDARIVYLVRDPIPRMLSHYAQNIWDRFDVPPFEAWMTDLEHPMNMPVWQSRYATQLERWLEHFPQERILVLDQRDLLEDRIETLRRVLAFLEVDPSFTSGSWEAEHNTATTHRVLNSLGHRFPWLARALTKVPGLGRIVTREVPAPELTPAQRERVVRILEPEAQRFSQLTGLPVDHWSL